MTKRGKRERDSSSEIPPLNRIIQERLGELGIEATYTDLPRRVKKAAKKQALGKSLSQQELARLDAIRRQETNLPNDAVDFFDSG